MFTAYLKNGETVHVPVEQMEEFIAQNRELLQVQQKEMGKRRATTREAKSDR
jgi:hypothetical protein